MDELATSRELQAMIFNLKEQRVLAKTMHTLDLEENYSMKLIKLGNRQLKMGQKRMKNKVSKIRSHLSAEEIADLRLSELEGRFRPRSTNSLSGNSKINAAAKRLRLNSSSISSTSVLTISDQSDGSSRSSPSDIHDNRVAHNSNNDIKQPLSARVSKPETRLSQSARAVSSRTESERKILSNKRLLSASQINLHKTVNSDKVNKLIKADPKPDSTNILNDLADSGVSPEKSLLKSESETKSISNNTDPTSDLPKCQPILLKSTSVSSFGSSELSRYRPVTSSGRSQNKPSSVCLRPKTAPGVSGYSSHDITTRQAPNPVINLIAMQHAISTGRTERRTSVLSTSSIGSAIAKERAAERRQDLIEGEQNQMMELENKKHDFMDRIAKWVKENPSVTIKPKPPKKHSDIEDKRRRMFGHVGFRTHSTMTKEERLQLEDKAWKELSKCRYLRIADEDMDLSGVNTLVKDQMALFASMKGGSKNKKIQELEPVIETDL